jgi:8-oxo-dGTP pyrophosphatase MutT (NUDIX family)
MDPEPLATMIRAALAAFAAFEPATPDAIPEQDARPAAVLVPVLGAAPEPRLVFTLRTEDLSRHAGEVSFPGGLADPGESLAETALREAHEELGLLPSAVELLGSLPPVHTHVSGIVIAPFVGLLRADPVLRPDPAEIAAVIEVPLRVLAEVGEVRWLEHDGRRFPTDVFEVEGGTIWGATGRILRSFLDALAAITSADA